MRTLDVSIIQDAVSKMVYDAALKLRPDVLSALKDRLKKEKDKLASDTLEKIIDNASIAKRKKVPICQDTGMTVVYCEIGRDIVLKGNIDRAIEKGVEEATVKGYLRRSIVNDPLERTNTQKNTPIITHYKFKNGNKLKISILLKGFGCENKGQTVMLNPTATPEEVEDQVIRIISESGAHACPPYVIGVGLGGTMDKAAEMSKEVLIEKIGKRNKKPFYAKMEERLIKRANKLGIGPLGLGGGTSVLDIKIKTYATHIAGMPLAVNVNCHAMRTRTVTL